MVTIRYTLTSHTLNNHYDIQVGPGASLNIQVDSGDVNVVTRVGKVNVNAGGDYNLKVGGNYTLSVDGHIARQSPAVVLKRSQVIIQRQ